MKVLKQEQLDDYQQNRTCYEIFHTYHPINENEQMIYKKTNPSNESNAHTKVVVPVESKNNVTSDQQNGEDVVATDRRPQNPQFQNRNNQEQYKGPNTVQNESETTVNHFNKVSDPTREQQSSETRQEEVVHFTPNQNAGRQETRPVEKRHTATTYQPTKTVPSSQNSAEYPKVNHFESQDKNTNQNTIPAGRNTNNLLSKAVNDSNSLIKDRDLQAEKYSEIEKAANQLNWVQKINAFELGYKKDLRNLPIPALRTFDLTDTQEMYLPLNDPSTLHDINSFTITKDMCILLLFRNNSAIKIAPETWYDNGKNREILLKNGFDFFYKQVDSNALVETLKKISITSASTPEMTQFIIKHMPFTTAE